MHVPTLNIPRIAACLLAACLVAGCNSSDARAKDALEAYQAAAASNDPAGARKALLQLVGAKDDVADYWIELGKVQTSLGSYSDAYYAFTRAYELDRSNPEVLRDVTELALRSGDFSLAQSHARELDIVAPGDPWVKLTDGWAAVSQSRFDQALAAANSLLAASPFNSAATLLKARALMGLEREDQARDVLVKQIAAQPTDVGSLRFLSKIYARHAEWPNVISTAQRLSSVAPANRESGLLLVEAALRSGDTGDARRESARLLQPDADPDLIASVLRLWEDYWPSPQRVQDARALANEASSLDRKLVYASFLNRVGSSADAVRLSLAAATLPVDAKNAEANGVLADAWSHLGKLADARSRFDAVLAFDPGNSTALRGRAELELRTGHADAAVIDAQKLVSVLPTSSAARLLLARCFAANGQSDWVRRTLWAAFQDIPGDEKLFAALLTSKKGDSEGTLELQREFARQRDAELSRGLI
jgi:tetratricopeptide (TPR) repeat protein